MVCKLGHCTTKGHQYMGGNIELKRLVNQGICPICKKKYIEYYISTSPSGYKRECFVHGHKKSPYSLGDINFTEEISCSRPIEDDKNESSS